MSNTETAQQGTSGTEKKYEPHLSELKTDEEQVERVRQLVLEADDLEEMIQDFRSNGVTKNMYFLQTFARESTVQDTAIRCAIVLLREGMESTGTGTLHYRKMKDAIELLSK